MVGRSLLLMGALAYLVGARPLGGICPALALASTLFLAGLVVGHIETNT